MGKEYLYKQCVNKTKLQSIITKIFTSDQIRALVSISTRSSKWSKETIKKAIRLRLACGVNGYKELLQQCIPLPSVRTLQQNLETFHFEEGICEEIFDILEKKVNTFEDERDKDAMIAMDEMSINSGIQFDASTRSFCGHSSLRNSKGDIGKKFFLFANTMC